VTAGRPFEQLEREFDAACAAAVQECRALGYEPTIWISMSEQYGSAEAARRLLVSGDIQTGFERLIQLGRPDLTIERAVLAHRWDPIFSERHRDAARWRLRQAGVDPPC
jgi:hypothetical protein